MSDSKEFLYLKDIYSSTFKQFIRLFVTEDYLRIHKIDGINGFITERDVIKANKKEILDYRLSNKSNDSEVTLSVESKTIILDFNNGDEPVDFFLAVMLIE